MECGMVPKSGTYHVEKKKKGGGEEERGEEKKEDSSSHPPPAKRSKSSFNGITNEYVHYFVEGQMFLATYAGMSIQKKESF